MTNLNNTSRKPFPFASNPTSANAAHNDSAKSADIKPVDIQRGDMKAAEMKSAKMWAKVMAGLVWMVRLMVRQQSEGGARRLQRSKRFRAVMVAVAMCVAIMPGTRAEKSARLQKIFKIINARMDALRRRHVKWRQRMCWMWGGGFALGAIMGLAHMIICAEDVHSFDALIPD